jgi:hypothetical protein
MFTQEQAKQAGALGYSAKRRLLIRLGITALHYRAIKASCRRRSRSQDSADLSAELLAVHCEPQQRRRSTWDIPSDTSTRTRPQLMTKGNPCTMPTVDSQIRSSAIAGL